MFRRIAAATIAWITLIPSAAAYFPDVPSTHPYAEGIHFLQAEQVARGHGDGTFRPQQTLTRAEFVTFLLRLEGENVSGACAGGRNFPDVPYGAWYAESICAAASRGMFEGYSDGTARPLQAVTFAEAAKLVAADHIRNRDEDDDDSGSAWYVPYVRYLASRKGIPGSIRTAHQHLTRGEMAEILWRADQSITDRPSVAYADLVSSDSSWSEELETFFEYDWRDREDLRRESRDEDDDIDAEDLMVWDEAAMGLVRRESMTPATAAKIYASLAVAQRDVLALGQEAGEVSLDALDLVSARVLCNFSQSQCAQFLRTTRTTRYDDLLVSIVLRELQERWTRDALAIVPTRPTGADYWSGTNPVDPAAGGWTYWFEDNDDLRIPPALPSFNSEWYRDQLNDVREAVRDLTPSQIAAVYAWAGSAGTETPSGIWLRKIDDLLRDEDADAVRAAEVRSIATAAMADAFIAVWRVKYHYWTPRPVMRDASIITLIPTPNFPSFPSGHAAVSRAVAEVLTAFYPDREEELRDQADEASMSRFWSGIHFPVDCEVGEQIGEDVGRTAVRWYEDEAGWR